MSGQVAGVDRQGRSGSDRIWASVATEPNTGCWLWTKYLGRSGYGYLQVNKRVMHAHRYSWEVTHGEAVPSGMFVLHRCDNPPCVNPAHLFLGTHSDNMADMFAKGRSTKGEANGRARLTEEQARAILIDRRPTAEIARTFGVGLSTVAHIKDGQRWRHLQPARGK